MQITPIVLTGINKTITTLTIRTSFTTDDNTANLVYSLSTASGETITHGTVPLTPAEFSGSGVNRIYLEDIVLSGLGLTRL